MSVELNSWRTAYIVLGLASIITTGLWYILQYDEERYSDIASDAHSERTDEIKKEFGRITSSFYQDISNHANYFEEDLNDVDSAVEAAEELLNDEESMSKLAKKVKFARRPNVVHSRCRFGAFYAPVAFICSMVVVVPWVLVNESILDMILFTLTGVLWFTGVALVSVHLYYAREIHKFSDNQKFMF